jgi:hypothetical protein
MRLTRTGTISGITFIWYAQTQINLKVFGSWKTQNHLGESNIFFVKSYNREQNYT